MIHSATLYGLLDICIRSIDVYFAHVIKQSHIQCLLSLDDELFWTFRGNRAGLRV